MNRDICDIIASNLVSHKYKLLDWIDEKLLVIPNLHYNLLSIDYISYDNIIWAKMCANKYAMNLIINSSEINWHSLSFNKNAISLLEANQKKINWRNLSLNSNAIKLLSENLDVIDWDLLSLRML